MSLDLLFHYLLLIRTTSEYTQEAWSETHYTLENSRTAGHRSNQYLQKHAY
jgi:hypothetical protein